MFIIKCDNCGQEAEVSLKSLRKIHFDGLIIVSANSEEELEFECFNCGHIVTEQIQTW